MATEQDFKTVNVEQGNAQIAVNRINEEAQNGYFPVGVIDDDTQERVTTVLLSQGMRVLDGRNPDCRKVQYVLENNTADEDILLIDLDNTNDYPHFGDNYLDLTSLAIGVDAPSSADYILKFGFLSDIDETDAVFNEFIRITSVESASSAPTAFNKVSFSDTAGILKPDRILSNKNVTTTDFNTTVSLPDTAGLSPTLGKCDLVCRVLRGNTDNCNFQFSIQYQGR